MSTEFPVKDLKDWKGAKAPDRRVFEGRFVRLEPLSVPQHGDQLWQEFTGPGSDPKLYDYMLSGPFEQRADFDVFLSEKANTTDPLFYAVIDLASGKAQGMLSFMRINLTHGTIEIGHVYFGASMQRSAKSTEAVFLLAQEAFALGNRRLEWTCNNENFRSKRAALRYGFTFEGILRQQFVAKGRNRDNAWYSTLDREWPPLHKAFQLWLSPDNFDSNGQQIKSLKKLQGECGLK
uniref:N-acetyltransferase domain-containing protein n=1 Tax=Plectus sambesii TaxID=2011161 RepID=A0A914UMN3_9BILA